MLNLKMINSKMLLSGATILAAGAVIAGATFAFFSDSETSAGNTFAAGAIDLRIDNESYVTDETGVLGASEDNSWELSDLTDELFFSFSDVKPGDFGEDTISIHVDDNPAYACMAADLTSTPENEIVDPEADMGDETDGPDGGELQNYLEFAFWHDDGDNVYEDGEEIFWEGTSDELFDGEWQTIADSANGTALTGEDTAYVAKAWCFGALSENPVDQDDESDGNPIDNGTGFDCEGAGDGDQNDAQTDSIEADVSFYAVQSRSNPEFLCGELDPFVGGEEPEGDRPTIGAALGEYEAPEDCDVTVDDEGGDFTSIQAAIDDSATIAGDTVCVSDGVYDEDVTVNKSITLSGDGATATSTINGQSPNFGGAVVVNADNVTVEGFVINGASDSQHAVRFATGVSGATFQYNQVNAPNGGNAIEAEGNQSGHVVQHNELVGDNSPQVAYVNGEVSLSQPSDDVDFMNNTFSGTIVSGGMALGTESTNANVTQNVFEDSLTSSYTITEFWRDDAMVNQNNFHDTTSFQVKNSEDDDTLNAEDNWWGEASPSNHTDGDVDDDPMESTAYDEN